MWFRLLFSLLLMLPNMAGAQLAPVQLYDIRIQAFSVCSHLLAYYNPNQDGVDLRHADAYRERLDVLKQQVGRDPELALIVAQMADSMAELEAVPVEQPEQYPEWLTLVLMAQAQLDQQLAERAEAAAVSASDMTVLQELRLDIERVLLLYQSRAFGLLGMYVMVVDENTVTRLDANVLRGFGMLQEQRSEYGLELARLKGYYNFIRPHLLEQQRGWVPSSAAYYLRQASEGLAQLLPEPAQVAASAATIY